MAKHQYTSEQALALLLQKVSMADQRLTAQVQAAIDSGKDVAESEPAMDRRKKARVYRKTVPFTHEEASHVALDALQAYFVEQPLFLDSAANNLAKTVIGVPQHSLPSWAYSRAAMKSEREPVSF